MPFERLVLSLHHVTATVDAAQADLDFCLKVLGLRLVKKTVNFDNHHVYHFYYGDERGTPGTIWTTFPYIGRGVPVGVTGAGQITTTSFSVPAGSLPFWRARMGEQRIAVRDGRRRHADEESIAVTDPSGLEISLVARADDARTPWTGSGMPADSAVRGLHSVTMTLHAPDASVAFMRELLGFEVIHEAEGFIRLGLNGGTDRPGHLIDIVHDKNFPPARNGIGTVHHVAMAVASDEHQLRIREELLRMGRTVTEVRDRQYFRSIYFREPGGVLFEVATTAPGFAVDEPLDALGRLLKLPPWEEPYRQEIEAGLAQVEYR
jgi:glyoxalase family protein